MTSFARRERLAIADLAEQLGPDAPTLCGDWTTRELLAHLIVRESSPLGAPGIVLSPLSGLTDREMSRVSAWDYADLVERVRRPSPWSPSRLAPYEGLANRIEHFIHLEDIRRAAADWEPRQLSKQDQDALWLPLRALGMVLVRKAGVPVTLRRTDTGSRAVLRWGNGGVEAAGLPSELVLFCYGREQAQVELTGDEDAIATLTAAERGL
jgi:uncharacterized protein (TIGR03085 family)